MPTRESPVVQNFLTPQPTMPLRSALQRFKPGRGYFGESTPELSFNLFVAGAIAGIFQLFSPFDALHQIEFGDGFEMIAIAKNLAAHGDFANPYLSENTGPTAVAAPLYPLFLALLTKILKHSNLVAIAAVIGNISINALIAAWLPRVSLLFYGATRPGIVAAVLWLAATRLMPSWDPSYTVAGLMGFCLFSASLIARTENATRLVALAGIWSGLLVLLNPSSVMVSLPWTAYLVVRRKAALNRAIKHCCVLLASMFLIVFPWTLRNYHVLGALLVRTGLGMTLYASNNDCAESSLIEDERSGCYQSHHPNRSVTEARLLHALGEVGYERRRIADTKSWVIANPNKFLRLTLKRFREFWFPPPYEHAHMAYLIWLTTALSIFGLTLMAWQREPITLFVATVLLIYPLIYYLVITDVRYRYPVLWLSLLPAGYSIAWLAARNYVTRNHQ